LTRLLQRHALLGAEGSSSLAGAVQAVFNHATVAL
jgi:hypothetical protein